MGFRYRKSFKAGPIRITASKSGISYSAGVKGARVTKRADGRTRTTLSAPGTGLSYTKTTRRSAKKTKKKASRATAAPAPRTPSVRPSTTRPPQAKAAEAHPSGIRVPTPSELQQAWRATGRPVPPHSPRISDQRALFIAGIMTIVAEPGEDIYLFLAIIGTKPASDVLVLTSRRLLLFHTRHVLAGSQVYSVNRELVESVTARHPFMRSIHLIIRHSGREEIGGNLFPKDLKWLKKITYGDPMFTFP